MEVIQSPKKAVVIMSLEQKAVIKVCLQYCKHRLQNHGSQGLEKAGVRDKDIEHMLKDL